jgi:proline-specific peptidase
MSQPEITQREGYIPFRGHRTWYRVTGDGEAPGRLPLLLLHGGPGIPSDYLEPLEDFAAAGRRVIRYDQIGCGRSDQPNDPTLMTVETFVAEINAVRAAFGLERLHILGQSWGGMLAMEYALTKPAGLAGLVISDSLPASHSGAEANRSARPAAGRPGDVAQARDRRNHRHTRIQ